MSRYETLLSFRKSFIPNSISLTENSIKIPIIDILKESLVSSLDFNSLDSTQEINIFAKYGGDGMSDGSEYKIHKEDLETSDNNTFIVCFFILKIIQGSSILFENKSYSSPFFCRPIRIYLKKESSSFIQEVFEELKQEINTCKNFNLVFCGRTFKISSTFFPSMNDGKVVNSLEGITNTKMCFICRKSGLDMRQMRPSVAIPVKKDIFDYGIQPLHLLIRATEWVLRISYYQGCENLNPSDKKLAIESNRKRIFEDVLRCFGFKVDIPSIRNGRSTDGCMSRKLFSKPEEFASILNLDSSFIKDIATLLAIVSSSRKFDPLKVLELCNRVYSFYDSFYSSRVNITPTLHKLLCHLPAFLAHHEFSPGILTEQSVELSHKYTKKFKKLSFTSSRQNVLRDILNRFLILTDPRLAPFFNNIKIQSQDNLKIVECEILDSYM